MSRKNTELEATLRKLRSQVRKLESERDRLAGRHANLEASLAGEQERAMHATQAAAIQVHVPTVALHWHARIFAWMQADALRSSMGGLISPDLQR